MSSRGPATLGAGAALLASTLLAATSLACGTVEPEATATVGGSATHTEALDSIAVMGHRYATGAQSDPDDAFSSAPENVWATGDNPQVQSVYQRLLATHPALDGHNFNVAQDVASVTDLETQLHRLLREARPLPDVVLIQTVDFDVKCDGSDADNYEPYAQELDRVLQLTRAQISGVQVFLVGDVGTVADFARIIPGQKEIHGGGPCALWDRTGKVSASGVRSVQGIQDAYSTRAERVCARYAWCFSGRSAFRSVRLALTDLTGDYKNLTIAGHAKLAEAAWRALPAEITSRP